MTQQHTISFIHAGAGIWHAVRTQPNFMIHALISGLVVGGGWWVGLASWEWVVLILTITGGLVMELVNTAIEAAVDLATSEVHPLAKIAKDCASGGMLVYSVGAIMIAGIIFIPKIIWLFF